MYLMGHPPYLGIKEIGPVGAQGRHRSRVGSFPEARLVLGEVTETMCTAGTKDFGRTGSGCFPRARHTPGESAFWRKWVLSPGETYPGKSALLIYVYWNCIMITRLKCQLSGDFLHLCKCDNTVYVIYSA